MTFYDEQFSAKQLCPTYLFEDKKGTFFVGTLNGLQTYDRATGIFSHIPMTFKEGGKLEVNVSTIIERANGEILIGTSGHGIFLLNVTEGHIEARQLPGFVPSYLINRSTKTGTGHCG